MGIGMPSEGTGVPPGPASLEAVRAAVGDEAFQAAMRDLGVIGTYRPVTIDDVVEALELSSGRTLSQLRRDLGLVISARD